MSQSWPLVHMAFEHQHESTTHLIKIFLRPHFGATRICHLWMCCIWLGVIMTSTVRPHLRKYIWETNIKVFKFYDALRSGYGYDILFGEAITFSYNDQINGNNNWYSTCTCCTLSGDSLFTRQFKRCIFKMLCLKWRWFLMSTSMKWKFDKW